MKILMKDLGLTSNIKVHGHGRRLVQEELLANGLQLDSLVSLEMVSICSHSSAS